MSGSRPIGHWRHCERKQRRNGSLWGEAERDKGVWQEVSRRTKEVGEERRKEGTNEGRKDKRREEKSR